MQWGKHTRTHSHRLLLHRVMNCSFVLSFPVQILCRWQVLAGLEKSERDSGFCLCSPLWGICRGAVVGGWGLAHIGEEPNLSWERAEEPKKTVDLQNKTLSMEMDIFTCKAPRRTTAEWLFNGKQGDCVRPAKGSPWETANLRLSKNSQILQGCSINTKIQVWI